MFFEWRSMQSKFSFSCPSEKIQNFCYDEPLRRVSQKSWKGWRISSFLETQIFFQPEGGRSSPTNWKIRSLGTPSRSLETQIFSSRKRRPSPMNRKIRSFGTPSRFFRDPDFQAERGFPFPVNRMIRSLGTPSCFLGTQIFKQKEDSPFLWIEWFAVWGRPPVF